jgi:hypothetical protein
VANQSNPLYPTYSPYPYVDAGGNPTSDPGTATAAAAPAATTTPSNVNIDPNASRPQNPYGTVGEPSVNNQSGQTSGGNTGAPATQATNAAAPVQPIGDPATNPGGNYTVDQLTAQNRTAVDQANKRVADLWDQIKPLQKQYADLQASGDVAKLQVQGQQITTQLNSLYNNLQQAQSNLETANTALSTSLQAAVKTTTVDPAQSTLYTSQANQADANAKLAASNADVLEKGSQGQRDLTTAQIGKTIDDGKLASAQSALAQAQADNTGKVTPAQIAGLQAQANNAQASADSTNALIQPNIDKVNAETGLTKAQTDLTGADSQLAIAQAGRETANANLLQTQADAQKALLAGLPAGQAATTAQALGAANQANANAAAITQGIQQNLLGPLYGLQDRANAIRAIQQQVFGAGGSGTPEERAQQANDLLDQFTTASIAGTTPYAANVAAANAGLTAFGTQASMYNAAQQALTGRGTALAGLGGNVLGTLAGMNANAPAGSTAMAGAFKDVVDYMANKMSAAQQSQGGPGQAGLQQPTAPQLPALLQRLAPGGQSAVQGGPAGALPMPNATPGAPGLGGAQPMPNPAGAPAPSPSANPMAFNPQASTAAMNAAGFMDNPAGRAAAAQANPSLLQTPQPAPQTSAPVTINIGGQGQGQQSQPAPPPGGYAQNQPGTYGQLSGAMPAMLQQYAPPTTDFVHSLWSNELGSGAVKSPYAAMGPSGGPQVPPVPSPLS